MRLVYLSPVPWASFAQRPHKFVEWFHFKYQAEVLWVDPYPTRLPALEDLRRIRGKGIKPALEIAKSKPAWLNLICPRSLPVEPLPGSGAVNGLLWCNVFKVIRQFLSGGEVLIGIGKPSELALQVLRRHPDEHSFYDVMDDFPAFYTGLSRSAMRQREERIVSAVSRLIVSSTTLAHRFASFSEKMSVVHNACAVDLLPEIGDIQKKSRIPVLGYVGTIGQWFDWTLVLKLANELPLAKIRLVGPVYVLPEEPLPKNIELLPPCDHETALIAMKEFNAGLIPFCINDLTASVDPIKYYEYMSLGLPVISTRFGEMAMRDNQSGVFIADTYSDFVGMVRAALVHEFNSEEVQTFRIENSWSARFDGCGIIDE